MIRGEITIPNNNKITLVENGEVVTDDKLNAESFNGFFIDAVSSLAIEESRALLDDVDEDMDPMRRAVKKFGHHPSIIDIKRNVTVESKFTFQQDWHRFCAPSIVICFQLLYMYIICTIYHNRYLK